MTSFTRPHNRRWVFATLMTVALSACGGGDSAGPGTKADANGAPSKNAQTLSARLDAYALDMPSSMEAASLAFMREEEALAQAVYTQSAQRWPALPIFGNIAASEARHTQAIKTLLDRYQLPDPLAGLPVGQFRSPAFQALYAELVAASNTSLIDALKVGVQIEELDIHDLQTQQAGIDNADILMVYDQLLRGSRNHLRAYTKTLSQQGGRYTPQHLSQTEFDAIVQSPMEKGH